MYKYKDDSSSDSDSGEKGPFISIRKHKQDAAILDDMFAALPGRQVLCSSVSNLFSDANVTMEMRKKERLLCVPLKNCARKA
jgi:hypothetical protein